MVEIFLLLVLASIALSRAWHESPLFIAAREYTKAWQTLPGFKGFVGKLANCHVCNAFHFTFLLLVLFILLPMLLGGGAPFLGELILTCLSATTLVHWHGDIKNYSGAPRESKERQEGPYSEATGAPFGSAGQPDHTRAWSRCR